MFTVAHRFARTSLRRMFDLQGVAAWFVLYDGY